MTSLRLILASLLYHRRMNLAVACGVVAGTAVLTGALLVGDSLRGSLEHLTLQRLGRLQEVLLTERFFRTELAEELAAGEEFKRQYTDAVPVILLRTSLQYNTESDGPARANRVNLIGCDERFWQLWPGEKGRPQRLPTGRQIVLNRPLAERLGVEVGGKLDPRVILRLPQIGSVPAESPLGRRPESVGGDPLTVIEIIPAEGPGDFTLSPNQQSARNAYVSIDWLAGRIEQPGRVNAILVAGKTTQDEPLPQEKRILPELLRPTPEDYGIHVEQTPLGYVNVTSERMLLRSGVEEAIRDGVAETDVQPALTYLANTIACGDAEIPYSTITAVDFTDRSPLGPFGSTDDGTIGKLEDNQIVLNSWAAEDLGARPGDTIRVTYFEPESTHGQLRERSEDLKLAAVVELTGAAADRDFTPKVPGITDQSTMVEWDPPFPFDSKRIHPEDEEYWDDHAATPKAFVSLAAGRRLWKSRFGQTTSLRFCPSQQTTVEALTKKLAENPSAMGFDFQPIRQHGLDASQGTMSGMVSFSGLFIAFSFFIIAAAMMLVALLFHLGIEQRAAQLGILVAVGLRRRRIAGLLAAEGLLVAAAGSLVGVPVGIAYAALMLLGLRTWWLQAIVTPFFLQLHVTAASLAIGFLSGVIVALLAILWAVWRTRRVAPRQLLAGQTSEVSLLVGVRSPLAGKVAWALLAVAVLSGLAITRIGREMQAGAFFGVGALVLIGVLMMIWARLRSGATGPAVKAGRGNLLRIALRNAARNPGRTTLTIGLVASACFLIVAVSAFHLDPAVQAPDLHSGNGGFAVMAQTDQPIYHDLNTAEGRRELGLSEDQQTLLAGTRTVMLRARPGDDASCLNLYRPRQPRVLGVPKGMIDRGGFAWAGSDPRHPENPWLLLEEELKPDDDGTPLLPVVVGKNTAIYSLHLGFDPLGKTYDVTDGRGQAVRLKVVGLLGMSIFAGDLLIGESDFLHHFPDADGYRLLLTEAVPDPAKITLDRAKAIGRGLESALGDRGLAAETTGQRLAGFLAVQNTYLSTFQSLGGLGLLLGTFGLAVVQLRNVLERRGELALLRAAGFRRSTLAAVVMLENGLLLLGGLAAGLLAALVAVLPHLLTRAASIPWPSLAVTLALVLGVGLITGLIAVRAVLTAPLLNALREE